MFIVNSQYGRLTLNLERLVTTERDKVVAKAAKNIHGGEAGRGGQWS